MTTTKAQKPRKHITLSTRAQPMLEGRRAESIRRRQRVLAALDRAATGGGEINASGIARAAGVDRTFLYRHRDLLEKIHALQADPVPDEHTGPAVTRASLQADLLAAHERAVRLNTRIQQLEKRLSRPSANKPGASPDWAPQPTSMHSINGSLISNSKPSTYNNNSRNATKTSPQPAPPTANSWPASTPRASKNEPPRAYLRHTCCSR